MIATHNIKVNGEWYTAGQEIPETKEQLEMELPKAEVEIPVKEEPASAEPVKEEKTPEPAKVRSARRKIGK